MEQYYSTQQGGNEMRGQFASKSFTRVSLTVELLFAWNECETTCNLYVVSTCLERQTVWPSQANDVDLCLNRDANGKLEVRNSCTELFEHHPGCKSTTVSQYQGKNQFLKDPSDPNWDYQDDQWHKWNIYMMFEGAWGGRKRNKRAKNHKKINAQRVYTKDAHIFTWLLKWRNFKVFNHTLHMDGIQTVESIGIAQRKSSHVWIFWPLIWAYHWRPWKH